MLTKNKGTKNWIGRSALVLLLLALPASGAEDRVGELEKEIAQLKAEVAALKEAGSSPATAELERKIEVLAQEIEQLKLGEAAPQASESVNGLGPAASKVYHSRSGVSIGGYGEMVYQAPDSSRDDGSASGEKKELDFLRGVFYIGYKFSPKWVFNSEIEFEHAKAGEESEGEAAVEFAYLEYFWRPELGFRAGLLLLPVGLINELHEPPVYLGARRPDVERVILPTTWRENGAGVFGSAGGFDYRAYVVAGLKAEGFSAEGLREGRQEGSESLAEDLAFVGRLDYRGLPGLLAGGSLYLGKSGQGLEAASGGKIGARTQIFEGHLEWKYRGLQLRALAARAELGDVARLNQALELEGPDSIGKRLEGYYLEAGYDVLSRLGRGGEQQLIPFVRYEAVDTQAAVPSGFARNPENDVESLTLGLSYKPFERVVIKADYQNYDNGAGSGLDRFNVALGYTF
ncbi:MAG TPA: hypothetical protein PK413_06985 [Thermoanaerobaculia bacterium]|nr:hypothetical protein [Thermoanaerobaculia bacterium]